jgi:hypothetical protein
MAKNEEVLGYCNYCKDEIYERHNYVLINGKRFHLKCYKLIEEEEDMEEREE